MDARRDPTGKSDGFWTRLFIILRIRYAEPGTYSLRMGYTASSKWICARNQWPCYPVLSNFSFRLYWWANSLFSYISLYWPLLDTDPENFDPSLLPLHALSAIEADSFWCLSRLLDGIQDNYIFAQPGIQRSVKRMAELIARIDGMWNFYLYSFFNSLFLSLFLSSSIGSPRITKRRIHAVRLPLDELSVNAWNQCTKYYPHVGYIFGGLGIDASLILKTSKTFDCS